MGLVAGGVWIWQWRKLETANNNLCSIGAAPPGVSCSGPPTDTYTDAKFAQYNKDGHDADKATHIAGYVTAAAGAVAIGTFVMGFIRGGDDSTEHAMRSHRRKQRDFLVTPVVTPDGGGATLRFDW